LYLFGREESRDAFAKTPAKYVDEARKRWRDIQQTLAR
jgi:hypothetical protein